MEYPLLESIFITANNVIISIPQKQRFCGNFLKFCIQLTYMPALGYNLIKLNGKQKR